MSPLRFDGGVSLPSLCCPIALPSLYRWPKEEKGAAPARGRREPAAATAATAEEGAGGAGMAEAGVGVGGMVEAGAGGSGTQIQRAEAMAVAGGRARPAGERLAEVADGDGGPSARRQCADPAWRRPWRRPAGERHADGLGRRGGRARPHVGGSEEEDKGEEKVKKKKRKSG